jgi:hypothetical protein
VKEETHQKERKKERKKENKKIDENARGLTT